MKVTAGGFVIIRLKFGSLSQEAVDNEFLRWNKSGGKVLQGLVNRREDERWLFLK